MAIPEPCAPSSRSSAGRAAIAESRSDGHELEGIVDQLANAEQIVTMLDHIGSESTGKILRNWIAEREFDKADKFLARISAGVGNELAETATLSAKSLVIDSNTVIALAKDGDPALRSTLNDGERARVAYVRSLPAGTELRVGNITVGETGNTLSFKGVPINALRDSPEYTKVLNRLERGTVGGSDGFPDQALVADAFFAKTEPGVTPRFLTSDREVVNKLARIAGIQVNTIGGFAGILARYGSTGFDVVIEQWTLKVFPVL